MIRWKGIIGEDIANEFLESLTNYYSIIFDKNMPREQKKDLKEKYGEIMKQTYLKMVEFANNYQEKNTSHYTK